MHDQLAIGGSFSSFHRNADMRTPLAQAADNGHAEIISMLIKADAMLETTDSSAVSVIDRITENKVFICICNRSDTTAKECALLYSAGDRAWLNERPRDC